MLHFLKKHPIKIGLLLVIGMVWLFCLPKQLFNEPTSTVLKSREGLMLGARIADDGQWRFPEQDSIPYRFEQCILNFEDEYFYYHPGFNPVAITKALWENLTTEDRRGGSTLTQQVIRLSRKNQERTYWEKVIEIFQATRLELRFSKKEILNLYDQLLDKYGSAVARDVSPRISVWEKKAIMKTDRRILAENMGILEKYLDYSRGYVNVEVYNDNLKVRVSIDANSSKVFL